MKMFRGNFHPSHPNSKNYLEKLSNSNLGQIKSDHVMLSTMCGTESAIEVWSMAQNFLFRPFARRSRYALRRLTVYNHIENLIPETNFSPLFFVSFSLFLLPFPLFHVIFSPSFAATLFSEKYWCVFCNKAPQAIFLISQVLISSKTPLKAITKTEDSEKVMTLKF